MTQQKVGPGRMVRFVHPVEGSQGVKVLVAVISDCHYPDNTAGAEPTSVDLHVFMPSSTRPVMYVMNITHNEVKMPGTWHWPERS